MRTFAAYIKNEKLRLESSSGGIFSLLAEYIFSLSGAVYGVAMSENLYCAEFIRATDEEGLKRIRGSKYLQARTGNVYQSAKMDLDAGKSVLFSGTPCQVNGLKGFLQKDYPNLLCVDVICHGVPSLALWRKYVCHEEALYGKLESVNFRCKNNSWNNFGIKENEVYSSKDINPYMQMFLRNYSLRPSCYKCTAKQFKMSDITLGDFWGINFVAPQMNDGKGTSIIIVRTKKGQAIIDERKMHMKIKEVSYKKAVRGNPSECRSVDRPEHRNIFFKDMVQLTFDELSKKYASPVKMGIKASVKHALEKFGGENCTYGRIAIMA